MPAGAAVLIATKLRAPAPRREYVPRRRLVARLREGAGRRLTLVTAPPGWGKTTLLVAWQAAEGAGRPFAWVSLDAHDNDPARFWSYVVHALREVRPELGRAGLPPLRRLSSAVGEVVVPLLLNALTALERPVVLVLDDYHAIERPEIHADVGRLIERAPASLHVALATRTTPPLPLPRLRARGELSEIRVPELRFDEAEADALLNDVLALGLSRLGVARLQRRTEGWAAGLYLAALSLRGRADGEAFVAAFAGTDRHLVDYLGAEVLDGLPSDVRAFLVETSILERLSGPLCDAVTGGTDSQRRLEEMERSNLFLAPLDGRREWFRYHQLFRQLLHHELDADRRALLHARAARWHLAHGTTLEAIHHALAGGDVDTAVALIAEHWNATFNQGRLATVTAWLDALDPAVVKRHPSLCAARAWLALDAGRPDDAGPWIEWAQHAAATTETAVLGAVHQFKLGDVGQAAAAADRARRLAGDAPSFARTVACCVLGFTAFWAGRHEAALAALLDARGLAHATGNDLAEAYATGYLALLAADDSALEEARALVAHATGLSDEPGFAEHFVLHVAHLADARTRLLGGELRPALEAAERSLRLAERGAGRVEQVGVLAVLARIRLALGDRAEARAAVAQAQDLLTRCRDPGVVAAWVAELADRLRTPPRRGAQTGDALSAREREILDLLAGPLSRAEIAAALFLSPDTVKTHLRGIYRKLATSSRADTVARARELGLL